MTKKQRFMSFAGVVVITAISLLACSLAMILLITFGSNASAIAQQAETVKQWTFNTDGDKEEWTGTNCLSDVVVQDGVLRGIVTGRDPFIVVSGLEIPARPWNVVQARLRIVQDEPLLQRGGELFYANSNEGHLGIAHVLPGCGANRKLVDNQRLS
jgi:hypothetical protein